MIKKLRNFLFLSVIATLPLVSFVACNNKKTPPKKEEVKEEEKDTSSSDSGNTTTADSSNNKQQIGFANPDSPKLIGSKDDQFPPSQGDFQFHKGEALTQQFVPEFKIGETKLKSWFSSFLVHKNIVYVPQFKAAEGAIATFVKISPKKGSNTEINFFQNNIFPSDFSGEKGEHDLKLDSKASDKIILDAIASKEKRIIKGFLSSDKAVADLGDFKVIVSGKHPTRFLPFSAVRFSSLSRQEGEAIINTNKQVPQAPEVNTAILVGNTQGTANPDEKDFPFTKEQIDHKDFIPKFSVKDNEELNKLLKERQNSFSFVVKKDIAYSSSFKPKKGSVASFVNITPNPKPNNPNSIRFNQDNILPSTFEGSLGSFDIKLKDVEADKILEAALSDSQNSNRLIKGFIFKDLISTSISSNLGDKFKEVALKGTALKFFFVGLNDLEFSFKTKKDSESKPSPSAPDGTANKENEKVDETPVSESKPTEENNQNAGAGTEGDNEVNPEQGSEEGNQSTTSPSEGSSSESNNSSENQESGNNNNSSDSQNNNNENEGSSESTNSEAEGRQIAPDDLEELDESEEEAVPEEDPEEEPEVKPEEKKDEELTNQKEVAKPEEDQDDSKKDNAVNEDKNSQVSSEKTEKETVTTANGDTKESKENDDSSVQADEASKNVEEDQKISDNDSSKDVQVDDGTASSTDSGIEGSDDTQGAQPGSSSQPETPSSSVVPEEESSSSGKETASVSEVSPAVSTTDKSQGGSEEKSPEGTSDEQVDSVKEEVQEGNEDADDSEAKEDSGREREREEQSGDSLDTADNEDQTKAEVEEVSEQNLSNGQQVVEENGEAADVKDVQNVVAEESKDIDGVDDSNQTESTSGQISVQIQNVEGAENQQEEGGRAEESKDTVKSESPTADSSVGISEGIAASSENITSLNVQNSDGVLNQQTDTPNVSVSAGDTSSPSVATVSTISSNNDRSQDVSEGQSKKSEDSTLQESKTEQLDASQQQSREDSVESKADTVQAEGVQTNAGEEQSSPTKTGDTVGSDQVNVDVADTQTTQTPSVSSDETQTSQDQASGVAVTDTNSDPDSTGTVNSDAGAVSE